MNIKVFDKEWQVVIVHKIGKININKYAQISKGKILSDEVIITDNRIEHIIERRGQCFYNEYSRYFGIIVSDPDYIFKDNRENTAIVSKSFIHNDCVVNIVLRLIIEGENPSFKNSIITAVKENNKRFAQRLRNNTPIYKRLDKNE